MEVWGEEWWVHWSGFESGCGVVVMVKVCAGLRWSCNLLDLHMGGMKSEDEH